MTDVHKPDTRSFNMKQIKSRDTKPELLVRRFLHSNGFRYRLHCKQLPGKPDIILPKYNSVVFVHGCFWHAHEECTQFKLPKTNINWWKNKLYDNKLRDEEHKMKLERLGWNVFVIWECELSNKIVNRTLFDLKMNLLNS